ncbi:MAG: TetR/AcrR family transcriptional regulator [Anaerofustis sp.]
MNITEKGTLTKQKIIDSAQILFYDQGYTSTTVAQITSKADVNNGLFTYYFGSKRNLASMILNEFRIDFRNLISKKIFDQHIQYNFAVGIAVDHRLNMKLKAESSNLMRFENELNRDLHQVDKETLKKLTNPQREHYYQLQKRLINPNISDTDLQLHKFLSYEIINALYSAYENEVVHADIEYLTDYYIRLFFHMLQLPPQEIELILEESKEITSKIQINTLPYFMLE